MRLLRKVTAMAMASMMVLSMAACGGGSSASATTAAPAETKAAEGGASGSGTIGVCIYKFDDAFMTTYRNALQEILEGKGYTVTFMDGKNDQAEQNNQINNFIAQEVDALIINPVMTSAADQIIATVKDANIPTVLINREPTADQMAAYDKLVYVGCDARQSGTMQGELILDTPNKGDINGDGRLDVTDLVTLSKYIADGDATHVQTDKADLNGDGRITVADVVELARRIANQ